MESVGKNWIFQYFKLFGLHSASPKKWHSLIYELSFVVCLIVLSSWKTYLSEHTSITGIMNIIESIVEQHKIKKLYLMNNYVSF